MTKRLAARLLIVLTLAATLLTPMTSAPAHGHALIQTTCMGQCQAEYNICMANAQGPEDWGACMYARRYCVLACPGA